MNRTPLHLTALLFAACTAPAAPPPAAVMLGEWRYSSIPVARDRPSLGAGLLVSIVVESAEAKRFQGRVTRWFAGDVGVSPEVFGPVTGSVNGTDGVTVLIPRAASGGPTLTMVAALSGDVLTVLESRIGGDAGPFPNGSLFERAR